jgi:hypothetical protein
MLSDTRRLGAGSFETGHLGDHSVHFLGHLAQTRCCWIALDHDGKSPGAGGPLQ